MSIIRRLGVNIDHVATIRQARRSLYPDPVTAAALAEISGADQITCHIRGDRRHIQDSDLPRLRDIVQTQLNVEMATTEEMISIAETVLSVHPWRHRVTLVPENPNEITTEGGLNVVEHIEAIRWATDRLQRAKIHVSLFIDPDQTQIKASRIPGVSMIEINTARYAEGDLDDLSRIGLAADIAESLDFEIAAGHGLTHHNLPDLVSKVPKIIEYNIGHSIIARSIFVGLDKATRDIVQIIRS